MLLGSVPTSTPPLFRVRHSESKRNSCLFSWGSTRRLGSDGSLAGCRGLSRSLDRNGRTSHRKWLDPVSLLYFGRMVICSEWPTFSFASGDIFDSTLSLNMWNWAPEFWLSQANHLFGRLQILSNCEDYGASGTILGRFLC
jgi:hypothetical protein